MIPLSAQEALEWTGGRLARGSAETRFARVTTDTRADVADSLFVALVGANHDAHAFVGQALAAGATGVLVERADAVPSDADAAVIVVPDSTRALGALAAGHRAGFDGPVVAITGSNGKTTTKEMCASILGVGGPCLKNRGNLNNEIGLPLTLLEREASHRTLVVELGMNHRGEIARLAAIARPTVGVITNVGTAHIEHLGSRDAIAQEKGDLVASLPPEAIAVLNADDPRVLAQAARTRARVVRFGLAEEADVRAERVTTLGERGFAFDLLANGARTAIQIAGLGDSTVPNALAAAAAALAAGASLDLVAEGLGRYRPVGGRMERVALPRNIILINDTYNANPQSMRVALESLAKLKGGSRGIAVLGDMGELGDAAVEAHRATGALVAKLGLDQLFALGEHAEALAEAAIEAGMDGSRVHVGGSHAEVADTVRELLQGNDWVLVKGSRSMRMERVVEALSESLEER
ncbi:MAG: UDP-N-acetylmuramoyl-tripeptide--D-alanyl-D-alanine ligase, partial [Myxococcota bacterium]